MPTRRRDITLALDLRTFRWHDGAGPDPWFRRFGVATREDAVRAWPAYRRPVFAAFFRVGELPPAAIAYDGLSNEGYRELCRNQGRIAKEVRSDCEIATLLRDDRRAVLEFCAADPAGAKTISDYLAAFVQDLDRLDALSRTDAVLTPRLVCSVRPYRDIAPPSLSADVCTQARACAEDAFNLE